VYSAKNKIIVYFYGEGTWGSVSYSGLTFFGTAFNKYRFNNEVCFGNPEEPSDDSPLGLAVKEYQEHCITCGKFVPIEDTDVVGCENCWSWTHTYCTKTKFDPSSEDIIFYCNYCQKDCNKPEVVYKSKQSKASEEESDDSVVKDKKQTSKKKKKVPSAAKERRKKKDSDYETGNKNHSKQEGNELEVSENVSSGLNEKKRKKRKRTEEANLSQNGLPRKSFKETGKTGFRASDINEAQKPKSGNLDIEDVLDFSKFEDIIRMLRFYCPTKKIARRLKKSLTKEQDKWWLSLVNIGSSSKDVPMLQSMIRDRVLEHKEWAWSRDEWGKLGNIDEKWCSLVTESLRKLTHLSKEADVTARSVVIGCNEILARFLGFKLARLNVTPSITPQERKDTDSLWSNVDNLRNSNTKFKHGIVKVVEEYGYSKAKGKWIDATFHIHDSIRTFVSEEGASWPLKKPRPLSRYNVFNAFGYYSGLVKGGEVPSITRKAEGAKGEIADSAKKDSLIEVQTVTNEVSEIIAETQIKSSISNDVEHVENENGLLAKGSSVQPNSSKPDVDTANQQAKYGGNLSVNGDSSTNAAVKSEIHPNQTVKVDKVEPASAVLNSDNSESEKSSQAGDLPKEKEEALPSESLEEPADDSEITPAGDFEKYEVSSGLENKSWFSQELSSRLNKTLSRAFNHPIPGSDKCKGSSSKRGFDYYGGFLQFPEYKALSRVHLYSGNGTRIVEEDVPVLPDEHGFQQPELDWWGVSDNDYSSDSDSSDSS